VAAEDGSDPHPALGEEQRAGDRSAHVESHELGPDAKLAVGWIPADVEVVDASLRLVVRLAEATVVGANGVSVSLERLGTLRTIAASNDTVLEMDRHQYESGEGPCVSAASEGHWFHVESLAEEERWPTFVPKAIEQGIKSILSTPLVARDRPLGALNIYSDTERAFGTSQQELAALFATQASGILADAGADVSEEERSARLADAMRSREVIAQAQGVVMGREGVTPEAATSVLRRAARAAGTTVRQVATEVVALASNPAGPTQRD
jgi:GAF domain-containing protein